ncbi:MAG: hypothetical protein ABIR47_02440 [Candidatus Kapaibacterium sp.]
MSQPQIALLTLEKITYTGPNVGSNFSFNFNVAGEINQIQMLISPGSTLNLTENLGGLAVDRSLGPFSMSTQAGITGNNSGVPVSGTTTTSYSILSGPSDQVFTMNVLVGPSSGPKATFALQYRSRWRDYPVSYDPQWLCRNRYDWSTFGRWLCLGASQLSDFYTRPEVIYLNQTFQAYTPRLQRLSNDLGLGLTPAGSTFLDLQTFSFNVVMGAGLSVSTLKWGRVFTLDDFSETVSDSIESYMVSVHPLLDFQVLELCRRWRELLDCFCRFCRQRSTLPVTATNYYDANIASQVDSLYSQVKPIAISEGMPSGIAPVNPSINCDRVSYIVSFWAWWCRRCPLVQPTWSTTLDPYYDTLYSQRQFLNDILEANSYTLCNPPEKNFCTRWSAVLDCLAKFCTERNNLPSALRTDIENTFGTFVRNVATFLNLPNISSLLPAGIDNTCQLLTKVKAYFDKLCPGGTIPGGHIRRTQLDTYLGQLETAMSAFKTRNGDLCASTVPMTNCTDWMTPLNCLKSLCSKKNLFTNALRSAILDDAGTVISDLFTTAFATPASPPAGATGIDLLCFKVNELWNFFSSRCPSGTIEPILKLRLDAKLASLQSAYTALLAAYPDICGSTVSLPPTWCSSWQSILNCLQRICRRSNTLNAQILDNVEEDFGSTVKALRWVRDGLDAYGAYQPGSMTFQEICESLDALLQYFNGLCGTGTINPVLKLFLDAQFTALQSAYNALLISYPGICNEPDQFCEEWLELLDCMGRLCDRLTANPGDQLAANVLNLAVTGFGTGITGVYQTVFGTSSGTFNTALDRFCAEVHGLLDWFVGHCACCGGTISPEIRTALAGPQATIMLEYRNLVACDSSCATSQLSVVSGVAPWRVTRVDDVQLSLPRASNIVTGTGSIGAPVMGSDWISPHDTAVDSFIGVTTFQRCFCVCTAGTVRIQITYLADDTADIYLDNTLVHAAGTTHMSASQSADVTLTVSVGRHCIRAEVTNNPATNMAFCAIGSITAITAMLLNDECCGDGNAPLAPCSDIPIPCDRIVALPRMFQFLCCPQRVAGDPLYTNQAYTDLVTALACFEGKIGGIVLALGELPDSIALGGSDVCSRMRRAVRVMLAAYMSFRSLPAHLRCAVDCFYDIVRAKISDLAATELNNPLPCSDACEVCTRWLNLLECLCRICAIKPQIAASHPALAAMIEAQLCSQELLSHGAPMLVGQMQFPFHAGYTCCEYLIYAFGNVLDKCLCCTEAMTALQGYEESYNWLDAKRQTLLAAFAAEGMSPCETACRKWNAMVDCLVKICMRRNELPQALRDRFDQLFSTRVLLLHDGLYGVPPTPSPFASNVYGTTCWGLFRILRSLSWYCSPLYAASREQVQLLETLLADFTSAYNTYMGELATAGFNFCTQSSDPCGQIERLADRFRTLCETSPTSTSAPVIALEVLLTQISADIPAIQKQLRLPLVAYPQSAGFCERLDFVLGLMAAARARYEELLPTYRAVIDLFFAIFTTQADAYAALIPDQLPRAATPMTEYRAQWIELLDCICRACDFVAGLTPGERDTYATIVDFFDGGNPQLSNAIADLYQRVWTLAPSINAPIINDPCADTPCKRVRILISFFTLYCLRCSDPAPAVVTALDGALDPLRAATVALRGAMQRAGRVVCTDENFETVVIQSESLYLQAAGSTSTDGTRVGVDGSSVGVHLRWALLGLLGDHMPKGNLAMPGTGYYGTNPFNRKDDFVKIYRAPYEANKRFAVKIDLTTLAPDAIEGTNADGVIWTFNNLSYDDTFSDAVTTVQISFEAGHYPWAIPSAPPYTTHVQTVRQNYNGVYRVEAIPKLMFALEVDTANPGVSPSVKFEAISRNDDPSADDPNFVSARIQINGTTNPHRIESESIEYALFQCVSCIPTVIRLETFDDFYAGSKRHYLLKRFGQFGLSLDDNEVYTRLEDPAKYPVDGAWPKFSTDGPSRPLMRVRVANYKDRWIPRHAQAADPAAGIYNRPPQQSLRAAVEKYLDKSKDWDNVEAWSTEYSIMPGDLTAMKISLLELLQLGAQDYHIARMLGLGAIDWQVIDSTKRYIYVAEYEAPEPLESQRPQNPLPPTIHRYLSLPTGQLDARLPVTPLLLPLEKGLDKPFTDDEGYTRFGTYRYMRLYHGDLEFDLPVGSFFQGSAGFSRGLQTRPILYGIKYASLLSENGTPEWAIPDPSNDASETAATDYHPYIDNAGKPEVLAIPDLKPRPGELPPPIFTHRIPRTSEPKPWHRYAIYGVNLFSRVSPLLNYSETFKNDFPVLNSLQPPLNLKAQYLQREDVPLLNAPSENNSSYFQKTRVTFDWNHIHDLAYQFADEVHFYVRSPAPKRLRGKIKEVELLYDNPAHAWVTTDQYDDWGNRKTETIVPALPDADRHRYIGSLLVTPSERFEIVQVERDASNSNYAKFRIKAVSCAGADGKMESGQPLVPLKDELFLVVENLANIDDDNLAASDWSRLDSYRIKLVQFPPHAEKIVTSGREEEVQIGGLVHQNAVVAHADVTGLYEVTMPGIVLGAYGSYVSNPSSLMISFYKGTMRVKDPHDSTKFRSLEVMKIIQTTPDLKLLVFDPEDRMLSGGGTSPMWGNFHPSYRIYIEWQAKEGIDPVAAFEPVDPEVSRITYMAAKGVHSTRLDSHGDMYRSHPTSPAVHLARLVQDLLPPAEPVGPDYASRPDIYGKASYTFDTPIVTGHKPYGLMFYRADEMAILGALYTMNTIRQIVPNLMEYRADDTHLEERWRDLINTNLDSNGEFKTYGDAFHFPRPDKGLEEGYWGPYGEDFNGSKKPSAIKEQIKDAIRNAFLPLTESYVVFHQITTSNTLQTSSKKPTLRGANGELLNPQVPEEAALFDPYPMIRKNEPTDPNFRVRFTDYTLDGASRNVYFYFTREVSSGLAAGEASVIKGPIRLVNTFPPVAPNLTRVRVNPENAIMETKPEVIFQFNPPPAGERIREIWIYRALNESDARNIRAMKKLGPILLTQDLSTTGPFEVRDTFSDIGPGESIPYGQPIYYRVVMARRIVNENGQPELVPSLPSETVLVSVMDTVNPGAPVITVQSLPVMADPPNQTKVGKLTNVVLRWPHTTYNATYRLYKMSPQGQWTLIKTFAPPHAGNEIVYDWSADHPGTLENPDNPNLIKFQDGNVLYHRFKVVVTNSSGLVSLVDEVKII